MTRRIYITGARRESGRNFLSNAHPFFFFPLPIEISQSPLAVQRDEERTDRRARPGGPPNIFARGNVPLSRDDERAA